MTIMWFWSSERRYEEHAISRIRLLVVKLRIHYYSVVLLLPVPDIAQMEAAIVLPVLISVNKLKSSRTQYVH